MLKSSALYDWPTVGSLLCSACDRFSSRVAIVDGSTRLTYADMSSAISRIIQALEDIGLAKGDGIAVLSHNRHEMIFAIAAANVMGLRFTALRA